MTSRLQDWALVQVNPVDPQAPRVVPHGAMIQIGAVIGPWQPLLQLAASRAGGSSKRECGVHGRPYTLELTLYPMTGQVAHVAFRVIGERTALTKDKYIRLVAERSDGTVVDLGKYRHPDNPEDDVRLDTWTGHYYVDVADLGTIRELRCEVSDFTWAEFPHLRMTPPSKGDLP